MDNQRHELQHKRRYPEWLGFGVHLVTAGVLFTSIYGTSYLISLFGALLTDSLGTLFWVKIGTNFLAAAVEFINYGLICIFALKESINLFRKLSGRGGGRD